MKIKKYISDGAPGAVFFARHRSQLKPRRQEKMSVLLLICPQLKPVGLCQDVVVVQVALRKTGSGPQKWVEKAEKRAEEGLEHFPFLKAGPKRHYKDCLYRAFNVLRNSNMIFNLNVQSS